MLPAVGVCLPGNAAFSKRFNTGVNHALERGLSVFIWQQCELSSKVRREIWTFFNMFCTKNCDRGNIHTAGRLRATLAARLCGIRATSGASCSQIRCPTTRPRLLLLQKKIPQTEHWLFAKITIKIAITRFIPSCCNVIDLLTLVLLTPLFTCKCDRAAVTPLKHHLVLQRCYTARTMMQASQCSDPERKRRMVATRT